MGKHHVYRVVRETNKKIINISTSLILVAMSLGGALPAFILSQTAHAAAPTTIVSDNFDTYDGIDADAPSGWTFSNIGNYTTADSSHAAPNSLQFNTAGNTDGLATLKFTLAAGQTAKQVSFWAEAEPYLGEANGMFDVRQSSNGGAVWSSVTNGAISVKTMPFSMTEYTLDLDQDTNALQFEYVKADGNVAFDDLTVTGETTGPVEDTTTGNYFQTIQAAIDSASTQDGDTITVAAGTYTENVTVSKPLIIEGANAGTPGYNSRSTESTLAGTFTITASNVTIDGFAIKPPVGASGVVAQGNYSGEVVKDNVITDAAYPVNFNTGNTSVSYNQINYGADSQDGISANSNPGNNIHIAHNHFSGNGSSFPADITVLGASNFTQDVFVNHNVSTTGATLVALFDTRDATLDSNTSTGATGNSAIYIGGNDYYINVTGNTIDGAGSAINVANNFGDGPNGNIIVSKNQLLDSNTTGLKVGVGAYTAGQTVNAEQNWWGSASGPSDSDGSDGSTPASHNGKGSVVTGASDYTQWCLTSACTAFASLTKPAAPTDLYFTASGTRYDSGDATNKQYTGGTLHLNWTESTDHNDIQYYRIERTYPDGTTSAYTILPNTITPLYQFAHHGEGYYTYRVQSVNQSGVASDYSQAVKIGYDTNSPTAYFTDSSFSNKVTPPRYVNKDFWVYGVASDNAALKGAFFDVRDGSPKPAAGCVSGTFSSSPATIDGSTSVNIKCQINTANLQDGQTYTLRIHAGDHAGYGGGQSTQITIDRDAPVIAPITVTESNGTTTSAKDAYLNGNVTFHVSQSEANPQRMYVEYDQLVNNKWQKKTGQWFYGTNTADLPVDTTQWSDGTYQVKVSSDDLAWNHAGAAASFTVDNTAPVLTIQQPAVNSSVRGTVTVSGTVTDNLSGATGQTVTLHLRNVKSNGKLDGFLNTFTATVQPDGTWSTTLDTTAFNDGPYGITGFVTDLAGNNQSASGGASIKPFTIDNTAPFVTDFVQQYNAQKGGRIDVTLTFSEPIDPSSLGQGWYEISGSNGTQFTKAYYRSKSVTVTFTDIAGNSGSYTFNVDNDGPILTVSSPAANGLFGGQTSGNHTITVQADASDPSNLGAYCVKLSGVNGGSCVSGGYFYQPANGNMPQVTIDTSNLASGTYTLTVRVTDTIGNPTEVVRTIQVDTDAPLHPTNLEVNGQSGTFYTTVGAPFTQTWKDKSKDVVSYNYLSCYVDTMPASNHCPGSSYTNSYSSASKQVNAGDTHHDEIFFWQVQAVDAAGNVSGWSNWSEVVVDSTKPQVSGSTEPSINPSSFTITATDTMPGSGIASVVGNIYKYDPTNPNANVNNGYYLFDGNSSTTSPLTIDLSSLGDGTYYVKYNAHDKAGNVSSTEEFNFTVDHTGPVVSITNPAANDTLSYAKDGTVNVTGTISDANPDHYYVKIYGDSGDANGVLVYANTINDTSDFNGTLYSWDLNNAKSGDYVIDLEARDAAGNKDNDSTQKIHVTVDNTGPALTYGGYTQNKNVITPTYSDPDTSDTYQWVADAGNPSGATISDPTALNPDFTVTASGSYKFTLTATDLFGNTTTADFTFDYTAPATVTNPGSTIHANAITTNTTSTGGRGAGFTAVNGQVLGASTTTPNSTQNGSDSGSTGHVKGDQVNLNTSSKNKTQNGSNSNFLGLGWWWLLILAAVLAFFWFLFRRSNSDEKA